MEKISFVNNTEESNLLNILCSSLLGCNKFYFNVAFLSYGGLQLFLQTLDKVRDKEGKIITSTYLNFSDPKAIRKLREFDNIDTRVYNENHKKGFHAKCYIFEYEEYYKTIIGSANITENALKNNIEWNVLIVHKKENDFSVRLLKEFQLLWEQIDELDDEFLREYERIIEELKKIQKLTFEVQEKHIKPNSMQTRAMENLDSIRKHKGIRALVVAATGSGKTYMSAFDIQQVKPKKVLFLVHREDILRSAEKAYKNVLGDINTGFFTGNRKDFDFDYLFATIQTMNNYYTTFEKDAFDYIVIDEAHHVTSPTYKKLIEYFEPEFLLGMTATPERSDGEDIFEIFDQNIAIEIRLQDAMEEELVVPFHYFGITDIDINYQEVDLDNIRSLTKLLNVQARVDYIIEKMNYFGHDGAKRKALGFCVSKEHAFFMSEEFNRKGIHAAVLTGEDSIERRKSTIEQLENNHHTLEIIFVVDVFNEGIDIPSINLVLMLRPTSSPIIFIQQLGRGLRRYVNKEYLTVLDFIGNHNRAFLIALALKGNKFYDSDSLRTAVKNNFIEIPGNTFIQMDEISKERIIQQLEVENFNKFKYLKQQYTDFKQINGGKIPLHLMTYLKYDGAPDPLRFMKASKYRTYFDFLAHVEGTEVINQVYFEELFIKAYKYIVDSLPIKRPYEFCILEALIRNEELSIEQCIRSISKYIQEINEDTLRHAIEVLCFALYDSLQKDRWIALVEYERNGIRRTKEFTKLLKNPSYRDAFQDIIQYGLTRYRNEFEEIDYGIPFLKLYQTYTMQNVAVLCNYDKTLSAFRGSGLLIHQDHYYLFVNLHKDENIKDSINYQDYFHSSQIFQWQTPNKTSQLSPQGQNIIFNQNRGINLHLFVRKYDSIDGVSQPYIYVGKVNSKLYEGEKPITVQMELEHELPYHLYLELKRDHQN